MLKSAITLPIMLLALAFAQPVSSQSPTWVPFGGGCAGSNGIPLLAPAPGQLPFVGQTFMCEISNVPTTGLGVGITGLSDQSWGVVPLPADLGLLLAMPGCTLYTDIRRTRTLTIAGGQANWPLPIPALPSLLGSSFFQQAFILDSGVPGLGAVMSNAGSGVFGTSGGGGGDMTVTILGGPLGNTGIPGVRVLRNHPTSGALLDDVTTNSSGVATFAGVSTARTTISVVLPSAVPMIGQSEIATYVDIPVANLTFHDLDFPPQALATFDVSLSPVPAGQTFGWISPGLYGDSDSLTVVGTFEPDVVVEQVQSDGLFSMLTMADDSSGLLAGCGMLLDQDPATVVSPVTVDTTLPVTSAPYTASAAIASVGFTVRRKNMCFELFLADGVSATSGDVLYCPMPGADLYSFEFEDFDDVTEASVGLSQFFATPPASFNVTVPDLSVSNTRFDFATQTASWTAAGTDLVNMDMDLIIIGWVVLPATFYVRTFNLAPGSISLVMPELPMDLSSHVPPAMGVGIGVATFGTDAVAGFDALIAAITANGGSVGGVLSQGTLGQFALGQFGPTEEGNESEPSRSGEQSLMRRLRSRLRQIR